MFSRVLSNGTRSQTSSSSLSFELVPFWKLSFTRRYCSEKTLEENLQRSQDAAFSKTQTLLAELREEQKKIEHQLSSGSLVYQKLPLVSLAFFVVASGILFQQMNRQNRILNNEMEDLKRKTDEAKDELFVEKEKNYEVEQELRSFRKITFDKLTKSLEEEQLKSKGRNTKFGNGAEVKKLMETSMDGALFELSEQRRLHLLKIQEEVELKKRQEQEKTGQSAANVKTEVRL